MPIEAEVAAGRESMYLSVYSVPQDEAMDIATAHARLSTAGSTFLAGKHRLLIDGNWKDARLDKRFDVFDAATGQVIGAVAEADAADVDEAVKAARRAFEG
jgi:hypothetical protein